MLCKQVTPKPTWLQNVNSKVGYFPLVWLNLSSALEVKVTKPIKTLSFVTFVFPFYLDRFSFFPLRFSELEFFFLFALDLLGDVTEESESELESPFFFVALKAPLRVRTLLLEGAM